MVTLLPVGIVIGPRNPLYGGQVPQRPQPVVFGENEALFTRGAAGDFIGLGANLNYISPILGH